MTLQRALGQRFFLTFLTLFLISILIFCAVEAIPGDAATRFLGQSATPESVAVLRERLGLDQPALQRYVGWLGHVMSGNFGDSLVSKRPISEIIAPKLFNTMVLGLAAFLLHLPLSLIPAALAATNKDRLPDHVISTINLFVASLPAFLVATFLLVIFTVILPIVPPISAVDQHSSLSDYLLALALPSASLAIVMAAYTVRMLRDNLIEVLEAEYIRMAELKGMSRSRVLWRHALPNALGPTLNVTALNIAFLVSGVVIVEKIFAYPGFGGLMVDAILIEDTPLILASVMIASFVYVVANLLADLGVLLLNPRLRG